MILFYEIKEKLLKSPILRDYWFLLFAALSVIINGLIWYYLHKEIPYVIEHLGTEIITLHYNIYFGIDYIGEVQKLYSLPALGAAIIIINLLLSIFLYLRAKLLSYFLIIFSLINQIILFFSVYLIILFNK